MAIRNILKKGDETLKKISRPVVRFDKRLALLIDDMIETMRSVKGAGLAAPQVGVLRRIVVIEIAGELYELVNPLVIKTEGEQEEREGCLSIPGLYGIVSRPAITTVAAFDRKGKAIEVTGDEFLSIALNHEIDHLNGVLYTDKVIRMVSQEEIDAEMAELEAELEAELDDDDEFEEE